jgi:Carboxypeptidase regulatory-like domain
MTRINEDRHHSLTRILFPFLVILFAGDWSGGPQRLALAASNTQGGTIRGRVVADIPDGCRVLPGVVVTLSGERLGDRKIQSISDMEGQFDFPSLLAGDYLITVEFSGFKKGLTIPFRGKKYKGRTGFTVFNITNHWNPRDVQSNLDSQQFGTFFNSPDRSVRLKFEFVKY